MTGFLLGSVTEFINNFPEIYSILTILGLEHVMRLLVFWCENRARMYRLVCSLGRRR